MIASYLIFFFAGLGAFNGLVLTGYLWWRAPAMPTNRWLAALILAISLRTGKSVLFYFWPEISKPVLQIGLTACFMIGPCLLGFVRACADPKGHRTRHDRHIAWGLLAFACLFGIAFPYASHMALWGQVVWPVITYSWLACLIVATGVHLHAARSPDGRMQPAGMARGLVPNALIGVAVIWLAYFTVGLTSYIVGALSFSLLLYLSGIVFLARHRARDAQVAPPYVDRKIAPDEAEAALRALRELMVGGELYKEPNLSLAKVARRLNMPAGRLSQLLNDNNKTSFKQYLAQLRIDAAKNLLLSNAPATMEQVAEASGFLSMSTFYDSFKRMEGVTPAAWRQTQQAAGANS